MLTDRALQNAAIDVSSGYMTVTAHTSFLREEDRILNTSLAEAGTNGVDFFGDYDNTSFPIGPEDLVETGDIIGIVAQNERMLPNLYNKLFNEGDGYDRHYNGPGFKQPYPFKIDNIYDNLGGGLLFTPNAQEAMSVDENYIFSQNGVDQVPRVWSDNFIEDFLCRDIPVIRSADAAEHVVPDGGEYGAFKESMDPLAFIARNYRFSKTGAIFSEYFYVNHFSHPTYPALTEELIEPDVYFPVRPGDGHFRFRDMYGNYHNEALTSSVSEPKKAFKDLANYFSDLDDTFQEK